MGKRWYFRFVRYATALRQVSLPYICLRSLVVSGFLAGSISFHSCSQLPALEPPHKHLIAHWVSNQRLICSAICRPVKTQSSMILLHKF